jgi:hypothetical protein
MSCLRNRSGESGTPLKESCKYLLVTATNLLQSREISLLQYLLLKELIFSYDHELYSTRQTSQHILEHILQYTKKLYEVLFQDLTLEHAHIIATTYADELSESMSVDTRALVYGEIDFDSFIEVLSVATDGLGRMNKFIDLGHGIGRAVLVVLFSPFLPPLPHHFLRLPLCAISRNTTASRFLKASTRCLFCFSSFHLTPRLC